MCQMRVSVRTKAGKGIINQAAREGSVWLEWRGENEKDGIMIMAHVLSRCQAKC